MHYQYDDLVPNPAAILSDGTLNKDQYKADLATYISKYYERTWTLVKHVKGSDRIKTPDRLLKDDVDDHFTWEDYIINV